MKYTASEKLEFIKIVEGSRLSVLATLRELQIKRSTFYEWYRRYQSGGSSALECRSRTPSRFWNKLSEKERSTVLEVARSYPEKSCREVAFEITDKHGFFVSESSVYRILKAVGLITSPVYAVEEAADGFKHPTTRINQLWQTDFTYFKITGWGWYYLSTVMDDFSRFILSWKLCSTMKANEV
jgi:transposase InsO family protein